MRKSLGDKRRQITPEKAEDILKLLVDYSDGDTRVVTREGRQEEAVVSRVFPTSHFAYPQDHSRASAEAQLPREPGSHSSA